MKSNIKLDNRWIVPYNLTLLKKYQAHINVEWCNKNIFIKYLFKYVTKGPDRSKLYLQRVLNGEDTPIDEETNTRNEVKEYLDARFICPYDSCWRILGYEIHRHFPPVTRLPVHLPNENYITYHASANMSQILSQEFLRRTMLTEWFVANQLHESARSLSYPDFPSEWRWDEKKRSWEQRHRQGNIGRIHFVHPSAGERYYLRMLLMVAKGAQNFESLRTYNNVLYPSFKETCRAHGLLEDDQEWYNAFDEAASWATSSQLRDLFVTMLLFCEVGDEFTFFEKVWTLLADDIQYNARQILNHPAYRMSDEALKNQLIEELTTLFSKRGSRIQDFNLPTRSDSSCLVNSNRFIDDELSYDISIMQTESEILTSRLNTEQLHAFKTITETVLANKAGFYFVSGYGGTGKTYLWNSIITFLRSRKQIVLSVASSGVASLLLPGGRTTHSRFKIPCELEETTVCDIKCGTMLSELVQVASLIIWDEALMTQICF